MRVHQQNKILVLLLLLQAFFTVGVMAQGRATDYVVKKVNVEFINTPEYQFTGTQRRSDNREKWMEIETEFDATPEFTEELTFKYYVQINKNVYTGEVTHVDIAGGKGLFSVMYISPRAISRILEGKPMNGAAIEKVSVEITKQGATVGFGSWKNEKTGWWASSPQKPGFLRNKNETPFAPLYWERYEAIKTNVR
ncbi:MAG: Amuc_1102 family pilus-like protein [Chthoniobacterales bacterium]